MLGPRLLKATRPKARKANRCSLCAGPINPGDPYLRESLSYNGFMYEWLTCTPCDTDNVTYLITAWAEGDLEDGIFLEAARKWAEDEFSHTTDEEREAAERFLERTYTLDQ